MWYFIFMYGNVMNLMFQVRAKELSPNFLCQANLSELINVS